MTELGYQSATTLTEKIQQREIRSVEVLDALVARMEKHNDGINAVVATNLDAARARAEAADAALENGEVWGPLHGLPITIKDSYEVTGMPTTSGAPIFKEHYAKQHALTVQRLVDAGAIVYGKTNLPIFAGDWQSYNKVYGTSCNPWDITRTPGGSSGGAAAALAAGLTSLELGSDIGGSIRIPAHYCGVCGHKPSHGIIPMRGHIPGPPGTMAEPDLAVAGPMARTAEDLRLMLDVLKGPATLDGAGWQLNLPASRHKSLQDFRVAVWWKANDYPIDNEIADAYAQLCTKLTDAGVTVANVHPIKMDEIVPIYINLLGSVMGAGLPPSVRRTLPMMQLVTKGLRRLGRASDMAVNYLDAFTLSHRDWMITNERREKMRNRIGNFFKDYDVLLMPVTPTVAMPHNHEGQMLQRTIEVNGKSRPYIDNMMWIALATALGLPATSAPVSQDASGLPINIQIVGAPYDDYTTIQFAQCLAEVTGGFTPPPGYGDVGV
ncbi:MAG: amidase [Chloroflexota bacterium]